MEEKFYTLQEAADILRVTERTVYRWIHRGYLHAIRVGDASNSRLRIADSELKKFLDNAEVTPTV